MKMNIIDNTDDFDSKNVLECASRNFKNNKMKSGRWEGWYSVYEDNKKFICLIGSESYFEEGRKKPSIHIGIFSSPRDISKSKRKPVINYDEEYSVRLTEDTTLKDISTKLSNMFGYTICDKITDCDKLEEAYGRKYEYSYRGFEREH